MAAVVAALVVVAEQDVAAAATTMRLGAHRNVVQVCTTNVHSLNLRLALTLTLALAVAVALGLTFRALAVRRCSKGSCPRAFFAQRERTQHPLPIFVIAAQQNANTFPSVPTVRRDG